MGSSAQTPVVKSSRIRTALKWLLVVWLIAWSLIGGVYALVHFAIVPRIDHWRVDLETKLTETVGLPVQIAQLRGAASGWTTRFQIDQIQIQTRDGGSALSIGNIDVQFSLASLWRLQLENLQVNNADVLVERDGNGQWSVAGVGIAADAEQSVPAWLDWVLAQPYMGAQNATVRLVDRMGEPQAWTFEAIDANLMNGRRSHDISLTMTPPSVLGDRLNVTASMRSGYFENSLTDLASWEGQIDTQLPRVQFQALRAMLVQLLPPDIWPTQDKLKLPKQWVNGGEGSLGLSLVVGRGLRVQSVRNDIGMRDVDLRLGEALEPIRLKQLAGQVEWSETDLNWTLRTRNLAFETAEGLKWPGGNAELTWQAGTATTPAVWQLLVDRVDIEQINALASRLPVEEAVRRQMVALMPEGLLNKASLSWSGDLAQPTHFKTEGEVTGLAWQALPDPKGAGALGRPGAEGVSLKWRADTQGGEASVVFDQGRLSLPGLWVDPVVSLSSGTASVRWQASGGANPGWQVAIENARLQTPDGLLAGDASWRADGSPNGHLKLAAQVDTMSVTALPRYLPASLPEARAYLATHVLSGQIKNATVLFDGRLDDFPFKSRQAGVFDVKADVVNATYDYARSLGKDQDWPAVAQLNGRFELSDNAIELRQVSGRLLRAPAIVLRESRLTWPDLTSDRPLKVTLSAAGPLAVWLNELNRTPLGARTEGVLTKWRGEGDASVSLSVTVPVAANDQTPLQTAGEANLTNVTLSLVDGLPPLERLQGTVRFTDNSLDVTRAKANWLGGNVEGTGIWRHPDDSTTTLRATVKGALRAEDVARTPSLGRLALAARRASGMTNFVVDVDQAGADGVRVTVNAPFKAVKLELPAPMNKAVGDDWTLTASLQTVPTSGLSKGMVKAQDLMVAVGPPAAPIARAHIRREYKAKPANFNAFELALIEPDVVRGAYVLGTAGLDALSLPEKGVSVDIRLPRFSVDEWHAVFDQPQRYAPVRIGTPLPPAKSSTAPAETPPGGPSLMDAFEDYVPDTVIGIAEQLIFEGRTFNRVVIGGARERNVWRANILADELNGYVQMSVGESQTSSALTVRLATLKLAEAQTKDVVDLLSNQPQAMPSLDVVVDALSLNGRDMGRLQLVAKNRQAAHTTSGSVDEWLIDRLRLDMPEASFKATGQWAPVKGRPVRRTYLTVELQLRDGGALLTRFGMPGVMRGGEGQISGDLAWQGAPTRFHTPSLSGALTIDLRKGQFLKADPGLSKLLGVLSLQSLPRRLTLDFTDVFSQGFSFDDMRGSATIREGIVTTNNLAMQGLGALVLMEGKADMQAETQSIDVIVVPKVDKGTLALLAASANPVIGVLTYFADGLLGNIINQVTVKGFKISGSWAEPEVAEVKVDERMKQRIPKPQEAK